MYKCKYFNIKELVPRHVYEDRGEKAWYLLDERALQTLDALRDKFGSAIVNDWSFGGDSQWRGLRTPESPYGSMYSQHRFGRAFDVIFREKTAEEVREYLLDNPDEFPYITAVEDGVSWFHFDTRNNPLEGELFIFNP